MDLDRRTTLTGLAATGAAIGVATQANAEKTSEDSNYDATQGGRFQPPYEANRPITLKGLLLNQERARAVLEEAKVDLLICSGKENYYYLTGHRGGAHLLGYNSGIDLATLSAHDDGKPTMFTSHVGMYFQGTAQEQLDLINVQPIGFPADFPGFLALTDPVEIANAPANAFATRRNTLHPESASETYRHGILTRESADIRGSLEPHCSSNCSTTRCRTRRLP